MESQHLTSHLCARKNTGESGVNCMIRTAHSLRIKWKKMGLLFLTEKLLTNFGQLRTGLSMMETSDHYVVAEQKCVGDGDGPY